MLANYTWQGAALSVAMPSNCPFPETSVFNLQKENDAEIDIEHWGAASGRHLFFLSNVEFIGEYI